MGFFKHEKAMVDDGAIVGDGTRVWANVYIQKGAVIGRECNVCNGSFIERGAVIGDHVTIKHNVSIFDGVTIEDDVFIGSNIAFINDRCPRSHREDAWTLEKTSVKKGATLGANAVVMCGITVGEYAFVGAGAVATKDVPPYTIVVGNPARIVGLACRCGRKLNTDLKCPCGKKYKMEKGKVASDA
ncbi:MAG: N-acetyltransferase [Candidatus Omnitrophica bacterium]|nr:N-acetyltransferase [Candidatus Omnitrophota bacterium]